MTTGWAPRPLRNLDTSGFVELETVVKHLTPIERQREEDGTPHSAMRPSALRPADPALYITKGSLVDKYDNRPQQPKQDPEDPMTTVKSYIAFKSKEAEPEPDKEMAKSVSAMNAAIAAFAARAGVKAGS